MGFTKAVIEAVLPLVDQESGTTLAGDNTRAHVINALKPICGSFTVADAVLAYAALNPVAECDVNDVPGDNPKQHAIFEACSALQEFVARGHASSPECAAYRIHMVEELDPESAADHDGAIIKMIGRDVKHVRSGRYKGHLFAKTSSRLGGWMDLDMFMQAVEDGVESGDFPPFIQGSAA